MRLTPALALALAFATIADAQAARPRRAPRRAPPPAQRRPVVERPVDQLDLLFEGGGVVDLHADPALHGLALGGTGNPGGAMRAFIAAVRALGRVQPELSNFTRQVTEDSLASQGGGVQVFSAVTRGLPPAYRASLRLYARVFARYRGPATRSDVALWLAQAAWVYGEVEANPDLLVLAHDLESTVAAVERGKVGAQLAIEGAFPFAAGGDEDLRAFFADAAHLVPASFPRPIPAEPLLHYARRIGVQYVSLNHLASSCFAGSDMRPNWRRGKGLSALGRRLIHEADEAGIMIDLAHASHQAQKDVVALTAARPDPLPLLVSHAVFAIDEGARPNWRTTLSGVLPTVRDTGGVVGIIGARVHLPHGRSRDPRGVINDIADQIEFVRGEIGIDHVALGLDGDGFVGQAHATTAQVAEAVRLELAARGYTPAELAKVFGGNYLHVLARRDQLVAARAQHR